MPIEALIFDFDGTLVRSHADVYAVLDRLTRRRGQPMPPAEVLRELSTADLLRTLGVRTWQIPWLTWRARRQLASSIEHVEFEPGLADVLRAARARGFRLGLVSSNSRLNVARALERHGLERVFDALELGSSLHGKQKKFIRMAKRLGVDPARALCLGDEVRDIEAARAAGMRSAAVAWGFHSGSRLKIAGPDLVFDTVAELGDHLALGPVPHAGA